MTTMDLSFLRPPRRLQMVWSTHDGEQAAYSGHLRDVEQDQMLIQLLGYGLVPSAPRAGERVLIQVPDRSGVYDIPSEVLSEETTGDLRVLVTGEIRRLDRRRFPRARVSMTPTTAFVIQDDQTPPRPITVRIVELSGGGARFESFHALSVGQVVQLLIPLPNHPPVFPILTVLEVTPTSANLGPPGNRVIVRAEFTRVLQSDRQLILRYVAREREFSATG